MLGRWVLSGWSIHEANWDGDLRQNISGGGWPPVSAYCSSFFSHCKMKKGTKWKKNWRGPPISSVPHFLFCFCPPLFPLQGMGGSGVDTFHIRRTTFGTLPRASSGLGVYLDVVHTAKSCHPSLSIFSIFSAPICQMPQKSNSSPVK